jgi:hypothetical protein
MLSEAQRDALATANALLASVGLNTVSSPVSLPPSPSHASSAAPMPTSASSPPGPASAVVQGSRYIAPPARPFLNEEIAAHIHKINRQLTVDAFVDHPAGAIVEYPQTGPEETSVVAHRFLVDPNNFYHPKTNIQYSLGGTHGAELDVFCGHLLCDETGTSVACHKLKTKCSSPCVDLDLALNQLYRQRLKVL